MKKKITLVVAMTKDGVIGHDNQLLWHLPNDLKHFKSLTMGKPIIMGRKTYASIGKPLPGRQNIILTRQDNPIPGCDVAHTIEEALALTNDAPEVMIIGGGEIYQLFYPLVTCMHITYVDTEISGETKFIEFNQEKWQEVFRQDFYQDEKHAYDYYFVTLVRK